MNFIKVLGINENASKAEIKKAYAAKLKVTRPDKDAAGFQRLHDAYKQALNYQKYQVTYASTTDEDETQLKSQLSAVDINIKPYDSSSEFDEKEGKNQRQQLDVQDKEKDFNKTDDGNEINAIFDSIDHVLVNETEQENDRQQLVEQTRYILSSRRRARKLSSWRFLEKTEVLYDMEFRRQYGLFLFGELLKFEKAYFKRGEPVLAFLNKLFHWTEYSNELWDNYDYESADSLLEKFPVAEMNYFLRIDDNLFGQHQAASYSQRVYSMTIDLWIGVSCIWFLVGFISRISPRMGEILAEQNMVIVVMFGYAIFNIALISSSIQATLGMNLFGLKIIKMTGERASLKFIVLRLVGFVGLFGSVYIMIAPNNIGQWFAFFWVYALLSFALFYKGYLFHDRMSSTVIVQNRNM